MLLVMTSIFCSPCNNHMRLREGQWLGHPRSPSKLVAELRHQLALPCVASQKGTSWGHPEWHWWEGTRWLGSWVSLQGWGLRKPVPLALPTHLRSG